MNSQIRLSIIVPFYGVERYIERCLVSLYAQDIPEQEYEIICINDCSPDNSEKIVQTIAESHSNLRIINHKKNLKLGAARNTGLRAANGKYVWFVDSDDYVENNCFAEILRECETNDLEILHFSIRDNLGNIYRHVAPSCVMSGIEEEYLSYHQKCIEITYPWNRVYNREFLLKNKLFFNDLYGGDVIHTIQAINVCQKIKNVDKFYHYYRVDNINSDTKSTQTAEKVFSMYFVLAKACNDVLPSLKEEWKKLVMECGPGRINSSFHSILKLSYSSQKELHVFLDSHIDIKVYALHVANNKVKLILKSLFCSALLSIGFKLLYRLKRQ